MASRKRNHDNQLNGNIAPKISKHLQKTIPFSRHDGIVGEIINSLHYDTFIIDQCPSIGDFINSPILDAFVRKTQEFAYGLIIKINNDLDNQNNDELVEILSNRCIDVSKMLISVQSTLNDKCKIFWKINDKTFFWLNLMHNSTQELNNFVIEYLIKQLQFRGTDVPTLMNQKMTIAEIPLNYILDSENQNLLMIAVDLNRISVVDTLLKFQFNIHHYNKNGKTAANIAWNSSRKNPEMLLLLLKANSRFPSYFDYRDVKPEMKELKDFIDMLMVVHNTIKNGHNKEEDEYRIKEIINSNKNLRHFYSISNKSAVTRSLMCRNNFIYQLLIENNVYQCSLELICPDKIIKIFEKVNEDDRKKIRDFHLNQVQNIPLNLPNEHIIRLLTNSQVIHDDPDPSSKLSLVKNAFEYLDKIDRVKPILELVAKSRNFKIIFDFNRSHINYFDPTLTDETRGVFYTMGHIFVAAKDFLSEETKLKGYGTLSHEICHYAMQLTYGNNCKPYKKCDTSSKEKFKGICHSCSHNQNKEEVIRSAFKNYSDGALHSELIARVPQLITIYNENQNHLEDIQDTLYLQLFDFYENTLNDMKNASGKVLQQGLDEVKRFYEKTKRQQRKISILYMIILCCLTLIPFTYFLVNAIVCSNCTFNELWKFQQNKIISSDFNFEGNRLKLENITTKYEAMNILSKLDSIQIHSIRHGKRKIGVDYLTKFNRSFCVPFTFIHDGISDINQEKLVLVTNERGSDKSIAMEEMIYKSKNDENSKVYWTALVRLESLPEKFYKKFKDLSNNISLADIIANELLDIKNPLDREIFEYKFKNGQVNFYWHDLEEIASDTKKYENAIRMIEIIQNSTSNRQLVFATTNFFNHFEEDLKTKAYELKALNESEEKEFLDCYIQDHSKYLTNEILKKLNSNVEVTRHQLMLAAKILNSNSNHSVIYQEFKQSDLNISVITQRKNEILPLFDDMSDINWECDYYRALETVYGNVTTLDQSYSNAGCELNKQQRDFILTKTISFQGANISLKKLLEGHCSVKMLNLLIHKTKSIVGENYLEMFDKNYCVDNEFSKNETEFGIDSLRERIDSERIIFIVGEAGTGKSTSLQKIALNMIQDLTLNWIAMIKLRNVKEQLENFDTSNINQETITTFLENILHIKDEFDREIFKLKMRKGQVTFFWDGLDELIFRSYQDKVTAIIRHLSSYQQWVTSRYNPKKDFAKDLGVLEYQLLPLQENQVETFMEFYINKTDRIPKDSNFTEIVRSTLRNFSKTSYPVKNRLLIKMIVDIFAKNKSTRVNLTTYYEVFNELFKITLYNVDLEAKDEFEKSLDEFDKQKWKCHYVLALKSIYGGIYLDNLSPNFIGAQQKTNHEQQINFFDTRGTTTIGNLTILEEYENYDVKCKDVQLLNVVSFNSQNQLVFSHQANAEYFVAKFLQTILSKSITSTANSNTVLRLLSIIASNENFQFTRQLLKESITESDQIKEVFKSQMIEEFSNIFEIGNFNIESMEFLSKVFNGSRTVIDKLWRVDENLTAVHQFLRYHTTDVNLTESYHKLIEVVEKVFNDKDRKKVMEGKNQILNVLNLIWFQNSTTFGNLLGSINLNEIGENLLEIGNFSDFYQYVNETVNLTIDDKREFFKDQFVNIFALNIDSKQESDLIWNEIKNIFNEREIHDLLIQKTAQNVNFLHKFVNLNNLEYVESIFENYLRIYLSENEIRNLILQQDDTGKNLPSMMITQRGLDVNVVEYYFNFTKDVLKTSNETKNHLLIRNYHMFTALHLSTWNDIKFFKATLKVYKRVFSNEELKSLIFDKSSADILFVRSLVNQASCETCHSVIAFIKELYNNNEQELEIILNNIPVPDVNQWCVKYNNECKEV